MRRPEDVPRFDDGAAEGCNLVYDNTRTAAASARATCALLSLVTSRFPVGVCLKPSAIYRR